MSTKENIKIEFERFRNKAGNPTCAINFKTGEFCKFFRTERFGVDETCIFAPTEQGHSELLQRRRLLNDNDDRSNTGFLIPGKFCILFNMEDENDKIAKK